MDARQVDQGSGGMSEDSGPLSIDDLPAFYSPAELEQLAGQNSQSLEQEHSKSQGGFAMPGFQEVSSSRHATTEARASMPTPSSSLQKAVKGRVSDVDFLFGLKDSVSSCMDTSIYLYIKNPCEDIMRKHFFLLCLISNFEQA